jgi:FkbM family methyltransferase
MRRLYYILLNIITLGKGVSRNINGIKIRFPAKWSRYYESDYEKENYDLVKKHVKPGIDIIDVGAHLGVFSVICSKLVEGKGKIVCLEPTPGTYSVLRQTLKMNHCLNVQALQAAVSENNGKAIFYVGSIAGCNSNSLLKNSSDKEQATYEVEVYTIDHITSVNALKPSLIKIDVEGSELDALRGGKNTFEKYGPVLILSLHPEFIKVKKDSLEAIWDLLENCKYSVCIGEERMSKEAFCYQTKIFDVHCFRNL